MTPPCACADPSTAAVRPGGRTVADFTARSRPSLIHDEDFEANPGPVVPTIIAGIERFELELNVLADRLLQLESDAK